MHATVRSYASDGGLVDALVARKDEVHDLLTGIAGFRAYYMLRTADGGAMSISIYEDASGRTPPTPPLRGGPGQPSRPCGCAARDDSGRSRGLVLRDRSGRGDRRSRSPLPSVMRHSRTPGQVRLTC